MVSRWEHKRSITEDERRKPLSIQQSSVKARQSIRSRYDVPKDDTGKRLWTIPNALWLTTDQEEEQVTLVATRGPGEETAPRRKISGLLADRCTSPTFGGRLPIRKIRQAIRRTGTMGCSERSLLGRIQSSIVQG